jgi:hypothetical protein|eukprot:COSAG01_NODE_10698_length_2102_cov_1.769346_2_plen_45_part_00
MCLEQAQDEPPGEAEVERLKEQVIMLTRLIVAKLFADSSVTILW